MSEVVKASRLLRIPALNRTLLQFVAFCGMANAVPLLYENLKDFILKIY